jgi:hypothetical protein
MINCVCRIYVCFFEIWWKCTHSSKRECELTTPSSVVWSTTSHGHRGVWWWMLWSQLDTVGLNREINMFRIIYGLQYMLIRIGYKNNQHYARKNLTSCSKSANQPSTSCVCACPKLSTSMGQLVNSCHNLVDIIRLALQGCSNKSVI